MTQTTKKKAYEGEANVAETLGGGFLAAADAMAQIGAMLGSSAAGVVAIVQRLRARQETIHALSGLDDAMLKDIGVQRHEITRLANSTIDAENDNQSARRAALAA